MNEWMVHTSPKALRGTGVELAFEMQGNEVAKLVGGGQAAGIVFVLARNQTAATMMTAGAATVGGARMSCHHAGRGLANAADAVRSRCFTAIACSNKAEADVERL
jgi:hypothetical protein